MSASAVVELGPAEVLSLYPGHHGTLTSLLASRVATVPERIYAVFRDEAVSYADFARRVERASAMFAARGVGAGDRVGVFSKNHLSTVVAWFALARLGATLCPINPDYRETEARYVLEHAQLCGLIVSPACLPVARAVLADAAQPPWLLLNDRDDAAGIGTFDAEPDVAPAPVPPDASTPHATSVIIYTSGTTGQPKGVMHAQRSGVLAGEGFVERMVLQPDDRLLCVLPMFHVNALFYSVLGSLAAGARLIVLEGFSASTFWRTVYDTGATEVNLVAAIPSILALRPRSEFVPGHRLSKICVVPLTAERERLFRDEFGVRDLIDGYGMTEIPGVAIMPIRGERRAGSCGRLCRHPDPSLTFAELRVVDDAGHDLPVGQTGEFVVRTPTIMQGYFRDPKQTAAAFRDGWFLTGDLGYRDADGFLWFVARKKDIIRKRGENISGAELDQIIGQHPGVAEAAAIAVPAALGEDEILVAVVSREGESPSAQSIADWCAERLARIKVPRYVVFVDDLPHTPTHRVAKHKLKSDTTLLARAIDLGEGSSVAAKEAHA